MQVGVRATLPQPALVDTPQQTPQSSALASSHATYGGAVANGLTTTAQSESSLNFVSLLTCCVCYSRGHVQKENDNVN